MGLAGIRTHDAQLFNQSHLPHGHNACLQLLIPGNHSLTLPQSTRLLAALVIYPLSHARILALLSCVQLSSGSFKYFIMLANLRCITVLDSCRLCLDNNWWYHSPVVIQKLLVPEALSVGERFAEGKGISGFDEDFICHCSFARRCLLPCRHIFHLNTLTTILMAESGSTMLVCFQRAAWKSGGIGMVLLHPNSKVHHATYRNQEGSRTITRSTAISRRGCYTEKFITMQDTKGVGQESSLSYLSAGRRPLTTLWESLESSTTQDGAHLAVMPDAHWV